MDPHRSEMIVVVCKLIEVAADKDELVREAVITSLRKLAKRHPSDVLENLVAFRKRNPKLSGLHLISLLRTMVQICQENEAELGEDVVLVLIDFTVNEMTANKDYLPELQMPASNILVALGQSHCIQVMEGLLQHFQPGVVPHYTVLHTMGALAAANVFGIVPFVKVTLGAMLPMMGMLRIEAMKQVFAYTLGKFSDAVLEYLANIDQAPDRTVQKASYETEVSIAYDVLVNSWLNTREPKVCETVLQAVGPMFALLSVEKVSEQVVRLIPTLLNLYRRGVDPYPVTQCMATVLLVATAGNKEAMEPLLDNLLSNMFELVCTTPDYAQPITVKNHCEVLRCFDRIAAHFSDRLVDLLLQQLKNSNERERLKALLVLTHLVNSSDTAMRLHVPFLVSALKNVLHVEQNTKVKKVLLKAVVAFAYRGYLNGTDGDMFVEFVVKHCCPSIQVGKEVDANSTDLRETCGNTLHLLATTVPEFEDTLWPLLLQFLVAKQYTPACATIARCLAHLAHKRREQHDLTEVKATDPDVVFARCVVLLASPQQSDRGLYLLTFLRSYVLQVSRLLKPLWEQKIPQLIRDLKADCEDWSKAVWSEAVLDLFWSSLREVGDEKWTEHLGATLTEQAQLYHPTQLAERGMLYQCLAATVCNSADKKFVRRSLEVIVANTRQHTPAETKSCARALGICARVHLDPVLLQLEHLSRDELSRKSSKMLGFMKDSKQEGEVERARLTLLAAYGRVAVEAPGTQLLPHVEKAVVAWVAQQLQTAKDPAVREAALQTLGNVAEALHPTRNSLHVQLSNRAEILSLVLAQLHSGQLLTPVVLQVATKFIQLPPSLSSEDRGTIVRTCFETVFECVADEGDPRLMLSELRTLCTEVLLRSVTPATLDDLFTLLQPWCGGSHPLQRLAAVDILQDVLRCYLHNVSFGFESPSKFNQCGLIVGTIVPRCTDGNMAVRESAVNCVRLTLSIAARYEGHAAENDADLAAELADVTRQLLTEDPAQLFHGVTDLAKVICTRLPHSQVLHFTDSLMDGLLDGQTTSSSGASVLLNKFLKVKGGELYHHVNDILSNILSRMANIKCSQTRLGSLRAVLSMANHHPKAVVTALLRQPIPYDECVSDCWKILAQDPVLSGEIIDQFLHIVSTAPLYEDQKDSERLRIAALLPLSAVCALHEMFRIASVQEIAIQRFPELFSMLLVALGCYVGTSPPIYTPQQAGHAFVPNRNAYKLNPARVALEAFQSFLLCAKCDVGAEALLQCSHMEVGESLASFIDMVPHLAKAVCQCMPHTLSRLTVCLNQYGTSAYDPQRITVAAFYAELVYLQCEETVLLESIVSNLLNCLGDPSPVVRRMCLKGLAGVARLQPEQRRRHFHPVLCALMEGLDDQDLTGSKDSIPLEAMRGLSLMLCASEPGGTGGQVSAALRIKPYFEQDDAGVRAAAFQLLGDLARYGGPDAQAAFQEQVHNNLLALLLHLDDHERDVVKACKYALRQVGPLLGADRINAMMQDHLIADANLQYPDFMADLVKIMVEELPDVVPLLVMHALSYIKSSWASVRGNAAMFIGLLCGCIPLGAENKVPLETVCSRLLQLLKDQDCSVRARAAEALSCLFLQ